MSSVMKSSKFSIIQVLAVIDCSILLKSHYIIQLLCYVIHAMRKLFEVRTMAAILIFTTHAIDACGISYQTGFNCVVHALFGNLCVDGAVHHFLFLKVFVLVSILFHFVYCAGTCTVAQTKNNGMRNHLKFMWDCCLIQ